MSCRKLFIRDAIHHSKTLILLRRTMPWVSCLLERNENYLSMQTLLALHDKYNLSHFLRKRHQSYLKMKCHSFFKLSLTFAFRIAIFMTGTFKRWSFSGTIFCRLCRIAVQICQTKLLVNYHGCQNCNISNLLVRESYETSYWQH